MLAKELKRMIARHSSASISYTCSREGELNVITFTGFDNEAQAEACVPVVTNAYRVFCEANGNELRVSYYN